MRAIVVAPEADPRSPDALGVQEAPDPELGPSEVLIRVVAAGVNRADVLQRQGFYPPPPGVSSILGLECAGVVVAIGPDVTAWHVGDPVCALLNGGGYATLVAVPETQVLPIPEGVSLSEAAALPEVACTVMSNLSLTADLQACDWVLIHGGASGIGTFAIQWSKAVGARVIVTVGSDERGEFCRSLGADVVINHRTQDFPEVVREATGGHGADVVLDILGAKYLDRNVSSLAIGGRLVVIGLQGGVTGELNLGRLLSRQGTIHATSLRASTADQKARICAEVVTHMWPLFTSGRLRPVIDSTYALQAAADAHAAIEAGGVAGKILLQVNEDEPQVDEDEKETI